MNINSKQYEALVARITALEARLANLDAPKPDYDPSVRAFLKREGIARSTLHNWEKSGIAPKITRVGGRKFIHEEDYLAWKRKH